MADTYYSRGARGDRTDVLTIYDARHLAPVGEVILPTKRQLSIPDSAEMSVTPDGRFVLVTNFRHHSGVSQGSRIAKGPAFRDILEQSAHDLSASRLR